MKTNIQINAKAVDFANGKSGYTVAVNGLDGQVSCKMNFTEPLKAMRYMFLLSKKLHLRINSVDLAAVQLEYAKAKAELEATAKEVQNAVTESQQEAETANDDEPSPFGVEVDSVMKQFNDLKQKHPDALLIFRCGDFYELYGEDAAIAANILGLTLTVRNDKLCMSGFPMSALDTYLPKLIRAGRRCAICDNISNKVVAK